MILIIAHMGELSAETLQFRGVRGYIVDGGCRDTGFILNMGFPVFCRYLTPRDVVGIWVPDRFGEPHRYRRRRHRNPATMCLATATAW